jgi:DNA-binding NarL/FixJ family response regulator
MSIRVLVCDDHPVFRRGLRLLLDDVDDLQVVAEAADGEEALHALRESSPDVAIVDLNMPGPSGVEVTRRMLAVRPELAVLVLTMFDEDHLVLAALRAGARGFLVKGATAEQVSAAVRTLASGELLLASSVASRLPAILETPGHTQFPQLSAREDQILGFVAAGRSNGEVARALFLSDKTVRNYVSAILTKLQAPNRAALIAMVRDQASH